MRKRSKAITLLDLEEKVLNSEIQEQKAKLKTLDDYFTITIKKSLIIL